jgi:hypothetical protein
LDDDQVMKRHFENLSLAIDGVLVVAIATMIILALALEARGLPIG